MLSRMCLDSRISSEQGGWRMGMGSNILGGGRGVFRVWAANAERVCLRLEGESLEMSLVGDGLFERRVEELREGMRYRYSLNGRDFPDPVSRSQPEGVHGPSAVVDPGSFAWTDHGWKGVPIEDYIIYELHVGTFTKRGTFGSVIHHLDYLRDELGITVLELMPVGQFPGERNWGYDGVYPYAPQNSYGGPAGLKRLVNECHRKGLAVALDVVYNHLGPEGNYLGNFGPYFTDRYKTLWGNAFNYDGAHSHWVRRYVIENALYWITEYHIDALRLDAIHGIFDASPKHILQELSVRVGAQAQVLGRPIYLIAESDLNDPRFVRRRDSCGYGLDSQWLDDFHHALHSILTGEKSGYYGDFGGIEHLLKSIEEGFVYDGQYSEYRKRRFGESSRDLPCDRFVAFSQNHDQVGNRPLGERICHLVTLEKQKLAAAAVILSPYLPLLFMGEEYAEESPFLYFVSHSDETLLEDVRKGREKELRAMGWVADVPDPADRKLFERSKLHLLQSNKKKPIFRWYRDLIRVRKRYPSLRCFERSSVKARNVGKVLALERSKPGFERVLVLMSFQSAGRTLRHNLPVCHWKLLLSSSSLEYGGRGAKRVASDMEGGEREIFLEGYEVRVYVSMQASGT